ncbi:MAG TPA: dihydrolipoamide acetyltransferase family protein [Candidatus Dormibacteraeota bacterium]|nr:dihydrolipoamide acetyltransferase family protein [Candidatus Dormibacteraeota bacterium]
MAVSVVMPALEMAQETGKLLAWRKQEGDRVTKGDALLEIETDKAVVEVEALEDGILAGITAQVGDEVPVGQTIAWIVAPGEQVPAQAAPAAPAARATSAPVNTSELSTKTTPSSEASSSTARLSPKARRLAKELGVDVNLVSGSGPEGTITAEDVQAFVQKKNSADTPETEALSQTARLMAERTTQSWTSVPHFFIVREVDASELVQARQRLASTISPSENNKLTITDLLIALVARALAKHPRMNASWTTEGIRLNTDINISVAMANKDGVVGAVIHKANKLELAEISALRHELTERARAARLRPADITGGSFTISNLGMYKVDAFTAIITPPQSAVLAVGAIVDRVVPVKGQPGIQPMLTLTLSTDHRVADGARAAEFMRDLAETILSAEKTLHR